MAAMKRFLICLIAVIFTAWPVMALDIAGTWFTSDGKAKVAVSDCGDGTPCGHLVWFDPSMGAETTDINNPDPDLQSRPLIGSPVFWGFKRKKDKWSSGHIYDAESGKTYKSKLRLTDEGRLVVKGCIGPICQKQVWRPALVD